MPSPIYEDAQVVIPASQTSQTQEKGNINDEQELPKLTKATEFENSVSEIERLLGIGEVKLPKVGAAQQNT